MCWATVTAHMLQLLAAPPSPQLSCSQHAAPRNRAVLAVGAALIFVAARMQVLQRLSQ